MAQTFTVKLSRGQNTPWGFRLAGGTDFNSPLSIQKVNSSSLAEEAGLQAGDGILKIGDTATENLRHKEAQDAIVRAGNNFVLLVQRGGLTTWKPTVTPVAPGKPIGNGTPLVTKTSLAANKQQFTPVGSQHNTKAKPFGGGGGSELNGEDRVTSLVHKQYNSPAALYSMQNIADTLTSQAEVLSTGAVGFNFMKKETPINKDSAVYRMVQEEATRSDTPEHKGEEEYAFQGIIHTEDVQSRSFKALQAVLDGGHSGPPPSIIRPVEAPVNIPRPEGEAPKPGDSVCVECGRIIVGVFVRIKDRSLHPECFKCTTCGASLKNAGYYSINEKLYCDIHAKQVASHSPPSSNLIPVTIPPGGSIPKDLHIVGTGTTVYGTPFGQHKTGPSPFHAKPSHPQTAPSGVAHTVTGSSKFVWPPPKHPEPAEPVAPVIENAPSPTIPSYRQPPTTQHIQFTSSKFKPHQQQQQSSSPLSVSPIPPSYSPVSAPKPVAPPQAGPRSPIAAPFSPSAHPLSPSLASPKPFSPVSPPSAGHVPFSKPAASSVFSSKPIPTATAPTTSGPTSAPRQAPRRGRGILNPTAGPGVRIPICAVCGTPIRGPFVTALGKTWCPDHFHCVNAQCRRALQDIGFVEEQGQLYCENCYETYLAPVCNKCNVRIKGDCMNAIGKQWHPECFLCAYCSKPFGNNHFYLEDGLPYCEKDWNELFTTKCVGCGYPIEAGDRWVEALNSNYHSQCFKCTICQKNLEGQSFYAKGGRPFCKTHAR